MRAQDAAGQHAGVAVPAQEVPVQRHAQAVDPSRARGVDILWENLGVNGGAARAALLFVVFMTVLMVCTCAMVVLAESAQSTVPPAIACDPPEEAGTLVCDAIWPAASYAGNESEAILVEVKAMMSEVNAVTCADYISSGQWRDTTVGAYDGVARLDASAYYDANGEWAGGFDATTIRDECSAMACFDCSARRASRPWRRSAWGSRTIRTAGTGCASRTSSARATVWRRARSLPC